MAYQNLTQKSFMEWYATLWAPQETFLDKNVCPLLIVKSEFLGYNVIMTRCSRHTGFNVRPRATKTVLGPRLLRSLRSSDSFGGTRADIFASVPRAAG